jgi:hypothetical protein
VVWEFQLAFQVKTINDLWIENEAVCILLFTCYVGSTLMPAPRSTIVDAGLLWSD